MQSFGKEFAVFMKRVYTRPGPRPPAAQLLPQRDENTRVRHRGSERMHGNLVYNTRTYTTKSCSSKATTCARVSTSRPCQGGWTPGEDGARRQRGRPTVRTAGACGAGPDAAEAGKPGERGERPNPGTPCPQRGGCRTLLASG